MKTLQKFKKDPKVTQFAADIVNKAFPTFEDEAKEIAKKINFRPDLDYIYNIHSKSPNQALVNEVMELYMNFNEDTDEKKLEKLLQKNLRLIRQALNNGNEAEVNNCWIQMKPYIGHEVF